MLEFSLINGIFVIIKYIMERKEKCKIAIERGITYNPETGDVIGNRNFKLKSKDGYGYPKIGLIIDGKTYSLLSHQFAWYVIYGEVVDNIDHINGVKDDNRICNLRSVTHQENMWNHKGRKGYCYDKSRNKWLASISINNKHKTLGRFDNEEDARAAYIQAKEKYHIINVRTTD